jgi:hypothetical protein
MKRNENFNNSKNQKKFKSHPNFFQILFLEDYLFNIFSFFNGTSLNIIRLVCKTWYQAQNNNYFISNQCSILKFSHNQKIQKLFTDHDGTVEKQIVNVVLGCLQGKRETFKIFPDGKEILFMEEIFKNHHKENEIIYFLNDDHFPKFIFNFKNNQKFGLCQRLIDFFLTNQILTSKVV